jgi:DNA-binding transcriptional regulator YdaS (Cro superfamily)
MAHNASFARFDDNPARQIAYSAWSQNPGMTATELLPVIEAALGEKVALRTVQDWRHRDKWEQRLAREMLAGSEVYVSQVVTDLRVAAPSSVAYLSSVAEGKVAGDALRIQAAKAVIAENRAMVVLMADMLKPAEEAPVPQVSSDISTAELVALAAGDRGAGGGGSGEG